MMFPDPIDEFYEAIEDNTDATRQYIEDMLFEFDLMIVPYEDPMNLRYGVDE